MVRGMGGGLRLISAFLLPLVAVGGSAAGRRGKKEAQETVGRGFGIHHALSKNRYRSGEHKEHSFNSA